MKGPVLCWLRTAAALALLVLGPVAVTTGVAAEDGETILRVQYPDFSLTLDPQKSANVFEITALALAYEGLTRLDTNQETVPAAAESWEYNDDATQITFHLREGLTYSDGSPLTAENFRYAVERTCDPTTAGAYQSILFGVVGCEAFASLAADGDGNPRAFTDAEYAAARAALGVRALDDETLQFDLADPAAYFHTIAYTWVLYPVKEEIVAADPDGWWTTAANHIGNGPFTITAIEDAQSWSFAANEHYWQGRPRLDGIAYVAYSGDGALADFKSGDLDIMVVDAPVLPGIETDPALAKSLLTYPQAGTFYLAMSLTKEPFTDLQVREAFAYAFDRDTFCAEAMAGTCEPANSWIPPGVPGHVDRDVFAFDPEAARAALAASSYGSAENVPPITASYFGDPAAAEDVPEDVQWIADQYRDVLGIELILEPVEGGELFARTEDAATYPQLMIFNGWFQDYPDPQNWLSVVWTCDSTFARAAGYCNEEFDRLTRLGDTTVEPELRLDYYRQGAEILVADVPGVFTHYPVGLMLVQPTVKGITPTPVEAVWPGSLSSLLTIDKMG